MWILAMAVTFLLSALLIPAVKRFAWGIGAIDIPRDWRRMHRNIVPRDGGIAIYAAVLIGCLIFCRHTPLMMAALEGGLLLLAVGLADDVFRFPAWVKLLIQLFAAVLAVAFGTDLAGVSAVLAVFWVLALTNAHNFVDGLDGLLGGTASVEGIALSLLFLGSGQGSRALPPLLIAAACGGFLIYNRPPAKIFAGDCGSGSIGLMLGVLSLPAVFEARWALGALAPLFVFAYPLTDLVTAVLRRFLRGKSLFAADRAHLHHRICATGVSQPVCTAVLLALSVSLGSIGVLLADPGMSLPAIAAIGATVCIMVGIRRYLLNVALGG